MGIYAPPEWQADPKQVKRIGVVTLHEYFIFEHRDPRGEPLRIIERAELPDHCEAYELAGLAFATHCGAVWIGEGTRALVTYDPADTTYTYHDLSSKGAVAGIVVQRRGANGEGEGMPLCIYFGASGDVWGIAGAIPAPYTMDNATRARALGEGVALAAFALGQQLRFSPSYTGNAMMRRVLADYERHTKREIPQPSQATRDLCMEHLPSPIQQRMTAIAGEGERITIHIYDRNMSYVSSAREVPVGDPVYTTTFHRGCPGLYLVMDLLHPDRVQWAWEPELRAIIDNDPDTDLWEVVEGYYWPKTQKLDLRLWGERIWAARRAARAVDSPAGRIAEAIVKKCGVAAIGRLIQHTGRAVVSEGQALQDEALILSYESDDSGELTGNVEVEARIGRDDLVWPHVWGTIISNANERLLFMIGAFAPRDTVLAYVDQFYSLQRHPELEADAMKAGGWKHGGTFHVPAGDVESLNQMKPQELVKAFARYQREEGER